jgi:Glycosyl transferase family 2
LQVMAEGFPVEIIFCRDNKEMTIGKKRQILLDKANGKYITMIDDDDEYSTDYFHRIFDPQNMGQAPDAITYLEHVYDRGTTRETRHRSSHYYTAKHHNKFHDWWTDLTKFNYQFARTPFYKDVIRTSIAKQIGFNVDLRYGEDHDFARRLKASGLILKEVHIDLGMYYYYMPDPMTQQQNNQRYGIK